MTLNVNFRVQRLLIRRTDSRELRDFPLSSLLVQTLWITFLGLLDRDVDPDLDKWDTRFTTWPLRLVQFPCKISIRSVGRNKARDRDSSGVGEKLRDLGDTTDVFLAVFRGEAEVFV